MLLATLFVLAGCGGDEEETVQQAADDSGSESGGSSNDSSSSSSKNAAPTIAGSPATEVMAGQPYSFQPTADDADGDELTFSVTNLPSWASFDASTGRVSGTPESVDVAQYSDIRISVSDGAESASLAAFSIEVVETASGSASLSWTPPTENTDGSQLGSELAGYKVYWGPSQGDYTNSVTVDNPGLTAYTVTDLTAGEWFFVATAFNEDGVESEYSNVASKQIM